jgi:hypothetical protein
VHDVLRLVTTDQRNGGRQQHRAMTVQQGAKRSCVPLGSATGQIGIARLHTCSFPPAVA